MGIFIDTIFAINFLYKVLYVILCHLYICLYMYIYIYDFVRNTLVNSAVLGNGLCPEDDVIHVKPTAIIRNTENICVDGMYFIQYIYLQLPHIYKTTDFYGFTEI
jgi:hypothetical protein